MEGIQFSDTAYFSKLFLDYVQEREELQAFYAYAPQIQSISQAISHRKKLLGAENEKRSLLKELLLQNYEGIENADAVRKNIESLSNENTFTITTGHQLSLFGGEWYFVYKIISTIKACEEAKLAFPDKHFVPVFWMASEDHDFEEINHAYIQANKFEWKRNASGPCGMLSTERIATIIDSLEQFLKQQPYTQDLVTLLRDAYTSDRTLAQATFHFVHALFGHYGLVVLEPNQHLLKKSFSTIVRADIQNNISYISIQEQSTKLESIGYKLQVNPREINFFYIQANYRERLLHTSEGFETTDKKFSFTKDEFEKVLINTPECISPNVCMRPLYQEYILPNVAYVGGPGEIAYWLQLKSNFEAHNIPYPILFWRNSFMWLENKDEIQLQKMGFDVFSIFSPLSVLQQQLVQQQSEEPLHLQVEQGSIVEQFQFVKQKLKKIDPTLEASAAAAEQKLRLSLQSLEKKMFRAEKRKHQEALQRLEKLKEKYFPSGKLQERHENFAMWYANCGVKVIEDVYQASKTAQTALQIIKFTPNNLRKED
jgi:bacillithiol biosynthesis cysteine-adding enzyme BshC